jgi:hypothetical protein
VLAIFGRLLEDRDLDDRRPFDVLLVAKLANRHGRAVADWATSTRCTYSGRKDLIHNYQFSYHPQHWGVC